MAILWEPDEKVTIGVDWGKGSDITAFRCSCGFHSKDRGEFVHHCMRAHRAGVILAPTNYDQARRG